MYRYIYTYIHIYRSAHCKVESGWHDTDSIYVCMYVCVCVRERDEEREHECVVVFMCVCLGVCVCIRERNYY